MKTSESVLPAGRQSGAGKLWVQSPATILKNYQPPAWIKLDKEKFSFVIETEPVVDQAALAVDISAIFEFYSR